MRNPRKLLLLAMMAVVAMAFGASTASAQTIEVSEEGGNHCGPVTEHSVGHGPIEGGCLIHATSEGEVELRKHVFGIESHITTCKNEFHGRVNETGEGYIFEQKITQMPLPHRVCNRRACETAAPHEKEHWKAHGREGATQEAGANESMVINFCIQPVAEDSAKETCEIEIPYQHYENQHRTEFGHATEIASHGISGFRCEIIGHWNTETGGFEHGTEQEVITTHP